MRKTFPTLRLDNVIRLSTFVLIVCMVMNANSANASLHFTRRSSSSAHTDTIKERICSAVSLHLQLDSAIQVQDPAGYGNSITYYWDTSFYHGIYSTDTGTGALPSSVYGFNIYSGSGSFPMGTSPYVTSLLLSTSGLVEPTGGSGAYPYGETQFLNGGDESHSTKKIKIIAVERDYSGAFVDADTAIIIITVYNFLESSLWVTTGDYNELHTGQTITLSNHALGGYWASLQGNVTIDSHGHVTGTSVGLDTVVYILGNTCLVNDTSRGYPLTITDGTAATIALTGLSGSDTIGATVTLIGTGFAPTASDNIVFFGATQATVTSASTTSLQVTVPVGATYGRITVLNTINHLMAANSFAFSPMYDTTSFIPSSFYHVQPPVEIGLPHGGFGAEDSLGGSHPYSVEMADVDGDGKVDIVVAGTGIDSIMIFNNRSSPGAINGSSYSGPFYIPLPLGAGAINVKLADLNGDGLPEVIVASSTTKRILVFTNYSTPGHDSFAHWFFVPTVITLPSEMAIGDYNNDGRIDIGCVSVGFLDTSGGRNVNVGGQFVVVRNKYNKGADSATFLGPNSFAIDTIVTYAAGDSTQPLSMCAADFDKDGKLDVAVTDHINRTVTVYRNNSPAAGNVTFDVAHKVVLFTGFGTGTYAADPYTYSSGGTGADPAYDYTHFLTGYPNQVRGADLDKDGYPELMVTVSDSDLLTTNQYNYLYVYQNTSVPGTISFGAHDKVPTGTSPVCIAVMDLDHDSVPEIMVTNAGAASVSIIKNTTSGGVAVSGSASVDFAMKDSIALFPATPSSYSSSVGSTVFTIDAGPVGIALGDMDGNNVPDIAVVSREMNSLTLLRIDPLADTTPIHGIDSVCNTLTDTLYSRHPSSISGYSKGYWSVTNGNATIAPLSTTDSIGILTGVTAGLDTVNYAVVTDFDTNYVASYVVKILPSGTVAAITGTHVLCSGTTDTLSDASSPGTWHITDPAIATVSVIGVVTGLTVGSTTISFTPSNACITGPPATAPVNVDTITAPSAIAGTINIFCTVGSPVTLTDASAGGTWAITNATLATVTAGGAVSGHAVGLDTVLYVFASPCGATDTARYPIRVLDTAGATTITGSDTACVGYTSALMVGAPGGTWSSSAPSIASVISTGVVTPGATGTAEIIYSFGAVSCTSLLADSVTFHSSAPPVHAPVTGTDTICQGTNTTLSTTATGGTWSSSNMTVATVDSTTGVVHGLIAGMATISYNVSTLCGTIADTAIVVVNPIPTAGTLTSSVASDSICAGATTTITSTGASAGTGVWSSSASAVASVDPSSGVVTGGTTITAPSAATISYNVTSLGCTSTTPATIHITVSPNPVAGSITPGGVLNMCVYSPFALYDTTSLYGTGVWSATGVDSTIVAGTVYSTGTTGSIVVTYTVNSLYGCGSVPVSQTIIVNGRPTPSITGSTNVCQNGATPETGTSYSGGETWSFSNGNATIASVHTPSTNIIGVNVGSDTLNYTATNTCGSTTVSVAITINPLPDTGTITGPSSICAGATANFYDTAFTDTSYVTYGSHFYTTAGMFVITPRLAGVAGAGIQGLLGGAGSGIIYYVANSASCGADTIRFNVHVYDSANSGIVSPSPTSFCVGTRDTLTITGSGAHSDFWFSSDTTIATVSVGSTDLNESVYGVRPGTVIISNFDTAHGVCGVAFTSDTVTILPLAPPPGVITGKDSICKGLDFLLIDTVASTLTRKGWSTTTGSIVSILSTSSTLDTITVVGLAGGEATFIFSDSNTCGVNADTFHIKVNDYAHLTSSLNKSICDSVQFTYTPTSDSSGATFAWVRDVMFGISNPTDSGMNNISEYLHDTTNIAIIDTYVYTTAIHGCATTADVIVTVNPTPYLISSHYDTVCSNALLSYLDTESTGPTTSAGWTRLKASAVNVINGDNSGSHAIHEVLNDTTQLLGTTFYTYTLTTPQGCTSQAKLYVAVDPRAAAPTITQHTLATVCEQTMYQNFGTQNAPVSPTTYSWYGTNGAEVWATGDTKQFCLVNFMSAGDCYIYVEANLDNYNCPIKDSFNVNVSNTINDFPQVIYFNGDFICLSNTEDSYQWGKDDAGTLDSSAFPYQTNQNYTNLNPDFTHDYYWVITNHGGCEQKSYYIVPTGVKNVTASMGEMTLYPNPANQVVNVELSNTSGGKYKVELVNMLGQKLNEQNVVGTKSTFEIANLAAGIYFVDCYRDGVKFATAKFVKN